MEQLPFAELGIDQPILDALLKLGYVNATPIQSKAIPVILTGKDVVGQAQTGTGKTFAFGIPIIQAVDPEQRYTQSIVLCPTRELAMQVADELRKVIGINSPVRIVSIYGGASIDNQIRELKKGGHIIVGTPGRTLDLIDRGVIKLNNASKIVLDEADEMLDMGFLQDIEAILSELPVERQSIFFSATMPPPIMELARKFMGETEIIRVVNRDLTATSITQKHYVVKEKDKIAIAQRIFDLYNPQRCLVFTNTKRKADEVAEKLIALGFSAEAIHGDLRQSARTLVMNKFRKGFVNILTATDVAARGIDVENVEMVLNYDVPLDAEYYVHRIGRTGRAGREGVAITLLTSGDRGRLREIERYAKTTIPAEPIPTDAQIRTHKISSFINTIAEELKAFDATADNYDEFLNPLVELGYDPNTIASALIKRQIQHIFKDAVVLESERPSTEREYGNDRFGGGRDRDRGADTRRPSRGNEGGGGSGDKEGFQAVTISLGRKHGIGPRDILGAFLGETEIPKTHIGEINIADSLTTIYLHPDAAEHVRVHGIPFRIKGHEVRLSRSKFQTLHKASRTTRKKY